MGIQQDAIIYIEDQDKLDASAAANSFADKNVKNRAYVNTLGAELTLKYLASENINISGIYNIHSIKKILEELDISDIMLPNIHIDVRVVFDENLIFIPKSHFKYNLVPDIYIVLNLAKDFSHVKLLGFFEPKLINKNNQNNDYYFIEKEKLNPVSDLKSFIENFKGNTTSGVTENDIENSERIIMAMSDNDVSEDEKQYLIKQLTKSAELRDKFIEYENFETLSYKAMTDPQIERKEIENEPEENINAAAVITDEPDVQDENIETFDSIENFDNLELEPIENIENISLDEISPQPSDTNEENLTDGLADIGMAAAAGTIAGAAAAETEAAEEITDTAIENSLNVLDTGIEVEKDLVNNETDSPEPIVFDDIDTSNLDNIATPNSDNFEEETISFDNIDTSETYNDVDYIDKIDNKISFDDIETPDEQQIDNVSQNSETISLDDIDTSFMDEPSNLPSVEDETISLEDIDTSEIEELNTEDNNVVEIDNSSSEEDLEADTTDISNPEDSSDEPMPFDDTEIQLDDLQIEFPEDESSENMQDSDEDLNVEPLNLIQEDDSSIETAQEEPEMNFETPESDELPETPIGKNLVSDDELQKNSNTGFGKSLLENINEENINSISIDDLDLEDTPTSSNAEEITSDELLSQIDNLLNSRAETSTSDETASSEQLTPQEIQNSDNDSEFDDIPDIDALVSSSEIDTPDSVIAENTAAPQQPAQPQDDEQNLNIDELLNMADDAANQGETEGNDKLGVLFNDTDPVSDVELDNIDYADTMPASDEERIPGAAVLKPKKSANQKTIITTAALVAILAGASAFVLLKPKSESPADIEAATPASSEIINNTKPVDNKDENILETNAPTINKTADKKVQKTKKQVKELKSTPAAKKPVSTESYLEVQRLVWDVPDVLSYSPKIQNYLRTAGKSIKLSLSADLLLATEYAYSNQVKVSLKLSKDGSVQDAKIISSSGSTEIDNIVLQSVKDTLNVVKPPSNEISTPDFNLNLIIYF